MLEKQSLNTSKQQPPSWASFWLQAAIGDVDEFSLVDGLAGAGRAEYSKPCWQLLSEKPCQWAEQACEWDEEQAKDLLLCLGESAPFSDQCEMMAAYQTLVQLLLKKGARLASCHFEAQCLRGQWQALAILIKESGDFRDRGGLWWLIEKLVGSEESIDTLETKLMFEQAKGQWPGGFVSKELEEVFSHAKQLSKLGQSVNRVGHNGMSARQCMQNFMEKKCGQSRSIIAREQCEPLWAWILAESEREMLEKELAGMGGLAIQPSRL